MGFAAWLMNGKKKVDYQIDLTVSSDMGLFSRLFIYADYAMERILHGISHANYFEYEFCRKNRRCRKTFVCKKEAHAIYDLCNPEALRYLTGDKATFNKRFDAFLGRKWIDIEQAEYEDFIQFLNGVDKFFTKPADGERGQGMEIVINDRHLDLEPLYKYYKAQRMVLEEVITQHPVMASLNPNSVNTIRIVTLRGADNGTNIMAAVLRIGRASEVVDNFHHDGICAAIDLGTGIVTTPGINIRHERFVVHPDSGVPIVGFKIPNWEKVTDIIRAAAPLLPELGLTGWDVAIGTDGEPMIIEGNSTPDFDVTQIADQIGKAHLYRPIVAELKKARN